MDSRLKALEEAVNADVTVHASAVTLINGLAKQLKDAIEANDWGAVVKMKESLETSSKELADAIEANTPPPVVEPPVENPPA